ncbi:MAG TPA: Rrf2 family transcriptional regulator [Polyangiales bacterium]
MKQDSRLSSVLHVLLHMAEHEGPMTSEQLAVAMSNTNPVVVRRTLAGLREAGFVRSERGHGGGWAIAKPLESVSLLDVHEALGDAPLVTLGHRSDNPSCLVERAVHRALDGSVQEAEALLRRRLAAVSLADLAADFHAHHLAHKRAARRSQCDV